MSDARTAAPYVAAQISGTLVGLWTAHLGQAVRVDKRLSVHAKQAIGFLRQESTKRTLA